MEWRDWKPDCSGMRSEWEKASVDDSFQKPGCLASGRGGEDSVRAGGRVSICG